MNDETKDMIRRVRSHGQTLLDTGAPHQKQLGEDLVALCDYVEAPGDFSTDTAVVHPIDQLGAGGGPATADELAQTGDAPAPDDPNALGEQPAASSDSAAPPTGLFGKLFNTPKT